MWFSLERKLNVAIHNHARKRINDEGVDVASGSLTNDSLLNPSPSATSKRIASYFKFNEILWLSVTKWRVQSHTLYLEFINLLGNCNIHFYLIKIILILFSKHHKTCLIFLKLFRNVYLKVVEMLKFISITLLKNILKVLVVLPGGVVLVKNLTLSTIFWRPSRRRLSGLKIRLGC